MSLEPDLLADRRRLRRRLTLWRALAIFALFGAIALVAGMRGERVLPGGDHVLRLPINGFIAEDRRVIEALDRAATNASVRAVIVAIDSPGGTIAGGEALHGALSRVAARKPVVALMGATAASAGYMAALPAARIYARDSSLTGSIGVLLQSFDVSELMARLGVSAQVIASGPLKDQPSLFRPLSAEGRAALDRVIQDLHAQFVGMVVAGRRMDADRARALADGRVFTGRQALDVGLIDAIGGEREARAWLAAEREVPESLPVRDMQTRSTTERLISQATEGVMKSLLSEWLGVDAPRALWQPSR
ncbi:signal peptide peptidase SppA [Roseomonas sp. PWR1]|uniref:Signal peptide peptidase SppA n=1 Tax=Roseomonas nitratireducens TaxID=2820810 RepID=A0ABS4AYM2_9PROT|nr:signal peptide peptidase SppA [Neoroseomonas nitratireducens]MBP0465913.1 signal peptide peptidase SppA [Neoroseomonas nitratireducens]